MDAMMAICHLSQEDFNTLSKILEGTSVSDISPLQLARLSRISHQRIYEWLHQGEKDLYESINSLYAQLSAKKEYKTGTVVQNIVNGILDKDTVQGNCWVLEKFLAKEFSSNSVILEEMRSLYNKMTEMIKKEGK